TGAAEPLAILSIELDGDPAQAAAFQVAALPVGTTLAAGEAVPLSVVFAPAAPGPFAATLRIKTDDDDEGRFAEVALSGVGVVAGPRIALSAAAVDFGRVEVGVGSAVTLSARNAGSAPLTIAFVGPAGFGGGGGGAPVFDLAPLDPAVTLPVALAPGEELVV